MSLPPLSKVRCCRPKKFGRLPEGLPHHVLASLVKGRWIDGKAQALILLLSVCDTPTFFYLSNFSAVKTEGLSLHQPSQKRTIPCPALNLPPLSKVRCCRPKKFGRLPEGLPHHVLASLVKGEVLSPEKFGRLPEGLLYTHQPLHPHNPLKTTSSLAPHQHPCL